MAGRVASASGLVNLTTIRIGQGLMAELQKRKPGHQQRPRTQSGAAIVPADADTGFPSPAPVAPDAISTAAKLVAQVEALQAELAAVRAKIAQLEVHVDIDPLTNVFNRRGFERELKRTLAYVQRYGTTAALVYLDLDAFKPINDTHGHAAGDAALKAAAAALVASVRGSDSVGRLGGDEFAVLLWNLSAESAAAKASALEEMMMRTPVAWENATVRLAASAGWTMLEPGDEGAAILARADAAMYARKRARKG